MLILATDMARHSEILESFKSKLDKFDFNNEDHLNSVSKIYHMSFTYHLQIPSQGNFIAGAQNL